MKKFLLLVLISAFTLSAHAGNAHMGKLSPWLRQLVRTQQRQSSESRSGPALRHEPAVCAFVEIADGADADALFHRYNSSSLAHTGNIHIARIPLYELARLSLNSHVCRIEARPSGHVLTDSLARHINALPVYQGISLPQAFTGQGVVVGLMDIGFDLTHPTFFDPSGQHYRISRLWDMLSLDTIGSTLPVGRDYRGKAELLALAHSRDAADQWHGTHTAGIAAGSGYDSPFRGMAPESDICLVSNAVSESRDSIPQELWGEFTFATDALGFKYLFDYAKSVGKPCVASFSEGSSQDFAGYDMLFYKMLANLVGPGRILVAAAGNNGYLKSWFRKDTGTASMGTFLQGWELFFSTLKSAHDFTLRLVAYDAAGNDTILLSTRQLLATQDSLITLYPLGLDSLQVMAYPSCYEAKEMCYDLVFYRNGRTIGYDVPLSLEVLGRRAEVEFWRGSAKMVSSDLNPLLNAGEYGHDIHSPSSAPCIISVGATTYRDSIQNVWGNWKKYWLGEQGLRVEFSSIGPTMDGRIKPDVVAPGNNIVSSSSSFFLEKHPDVDEATWDVERFDLNGRTYTWHSATGTSMSCPAVAGAIALWLQARPDLTPEQALDVIAHTARQPEPQLSYPNNYYGYGEIDVYRGLLYLLGIDAIESVSARHTQADVRLSGKQLRVALPQPAEQSVTVGIYSVDGRLRHTASLAKGLQQATIPLPCLPPGIYAVQIGREGSTLIRVRP